MPKKATNKEYLELWREFCENMDNATPIDLKESHADKLKRIKYLEANDEEWFKFYFPIYYTSEAADFHIKSTKLVMSKPELYLVRSWARELSKSGRTMFEVLKLTLTGKKKNVLFVSNSADNADRLLLPYKGILECNNRIINDYGVQKKQVPGKLPNLKHAKVFLLGLLGQDNRHVEPGIMPHALMLFLLMILY